MFDAATRIVPLATVLVTTAGAAGAGVGVAVDVVDWIVVEDGVDVVLVVDDELENAGELEAAGWLLPPQATSETAATANTPAVSGRGCWAVEPTMRLAAGRSLRIALICRPLQLFSGEALNKLRHRRLPM